MPGADFNDATEATAKAWQALTTDQRETYVQQALKEREAYQAANKVYQERKSLQAKVRAPAALAPQYPGVLCGLFMLSW